MDIDKVWKRMLILDAERSGMDTNPKSPDYKKVVVLFGSQAKYLKLLKQAIQEQMNGT